MVTTWFLLGVLAAAQPADKADWLLVPRLGPAQELLYRGSFSEKADGAGVQFNRNDRVEVRVFVMGTAPKGTDVALFTSVQAVGMDRGRLGTPPSASVRLELAHLDLQGRLAVDSAASALCPLEGPPTLECGPFVEAPRGRIGVEKPWEAREEGRPNRTWRLTGFENAGGINCLKLVGVQQSDDWDQPHGNRTAWRRTDTVWLLPRFGVAQKLERVIERRAPARQEVTQRSVLSYELETGLQYPGQLGEDRRKEILAARKFAEDLAPYQSAPGRYPAQLEGLATKIAHHLDNLPPTPYREAVLAVQRRAAAARRGESPPAPLIEDNDAAPAVIQVGRLAPDFVLGDFAGKETVRRRSWLGKPVLMVFYNPASATAAELLRFAQATADAHKDAVVVGLPLTENAEVVDRQRGALKLTIPLLRGGGLRQSYDVEATPKLVVLDAQGVVCGAFVGWGNETMEAVQVEVKHALEGRR